MARWEHLALTCLGTEKNQSNRWHFEVSDCGQGGDQQERDWNLVKGTEL